MQRELPREELAVGPQHHVGGLDGVEVADRRHREGVLVVVERVRADDRLVDAAVAALPDPAEPVDEEVVADVAPAAGLHVVGVDAAQDRRHLGLGVVVGVDRVVDEAAADRAVAQGALVADALVGAPLGAGVDRRLRDGLARARGWRARPCEPDPGAALQRALLGVVARRRTSVPVLGPSAGFSTSLALAEPGSTSASERSSGRVAPSVRALTCTSSTSPTNIGSVPGRALAASSLPASGPCSSWYSRSSQSLHSSPVRVRTCRAIWSSVEVLAVLPGHADRGEARDGLRLAGDPRVGGAARDRATAQAGEAAAGRR